MAHFPARVLKEICKKPARLFTHAVVFGLAAFQFGCASVKHSSAEPSLPPETQEAILRGIVQNANGQPFKLMEAKKYDTLMRDVQGIWKEIVSYTPSEEEDPQRHVEQLQEKLNDAKEYLCSNVKALNHGEAKSKLTCEESFTDDDLIQIARRYDGQIGAMGVRIGGKGRELKLLVIDGIDNLLQPSSLDKDFFNQGLLLEGLDEVFGERFRQILREQALRHEAAHLGDTRPLVEEAKKSGKGMETVEIKKEIYADEVADRGMDKDDEHIEFLKVWVHFRALNSVLTGDMGHAVQFQDAKLLKEYDPSFKDYAELDVERIYKAVEAIRVASPTVEV